MSYLHSHAFYRYCLALRLSLQKVRGAQYDILHLGGACGDAAIIVRDHLVKKGIKAICVQGVFTRHNDHCWTRAWSGQTPYVIDITATQFKKTMPPVFIQAENTISRRMYRSGYEISSLEECDTLTHHQRRNVLARARRVIQGEA